MGNHKDRPEVKQAMEEGKEKPFVSRNLIKKTFYYALRLDDGRLVRVAKRQTVYFKPCFPGFFDGNPADCNFGICLLIS